jgi:hypothetical protein
MFEKIVMGLIIFVFGLVIFTVGFLAYGHLTQKATITVLVVNKDIVTSTSQSCNKIGETTTCVPVTSVSYRIYSDVESFSTSEGLYQVITVGKNHTFNVTGWFGSRYINRVLE